MKNHEQIWSNHYSEKRGLRLHYPESFVDRLLRSKTPEPGLKNQNIRGSRVLDLSCGYGRNLHLLKALGAELYATEINDVIVEGLKTQIEGVDFRVGKAHQLPFEDSFFDGVVACNSCYYLDEHIDFQDSLTEIQRIIKPSGWFLGSLPDVNHSIFDQAEKLEDGSFLVKNDRLDLRNNYRLHAADSQKTVETLLSKHFIDIKIGHIAEQFQEFNRCLFYFTCYKNPTDS